MKGAMLAVEIIGPFRRVVLGERPLLAPIASDDVGAAALHEMPREPNARALVFQRQARKFGIEKTEQAVERLLVAAMRRSRQQHEMALGVCRDRTQELEALLPAEMRPYA